MKPIFNLLRVSVAILIMSLSTIINAQAQNSTMTTQPMDTIAPKAMDTIPPAPPQEAEKEKKAEKEKNDGFNSKTRLGFRAGVNISKQDFESGSITEDPESKLGGDLAVLVGIPIGGGFFMVQPELHWLQKGYKIADAGSLGEVTSTLNYIELPLLLRVNFGGSLRLFAFAGPSAGYLIGGTYEDANGEQDPTDFLEELEYSGHLGLGIGLGTFEVDLRYIAGLTDIADSPNLSDVKNSSFGAGVTLKF